MEAKKMYIVGYDCTKYDGTVEFETRYCGYSETKARTVYRSFIARKGAVFKIIDNLNELSDYYQGESLEGAVATVEAKIRRKLAEVLGAHYNYQHRTMKDVFEELNSVSCTPHVRRFGNEPGKLKLRMSYNGSEYSSARSNLSLEEIAECLSFHVKQAKREAGMTHIPVLLRLVDSNTQTTRDLEV